MYIFINPKPLAPKKRESAFLCAISILSGICFIDIIPGGDSVTKLAVAIVHGIGNQKEDFAHHFIKCIKRKLKKINPEIQVCFQLVYWADLLAEKENELFRRLAQKGEMSYRRLRYFMVQFAGDAIAYQPIEKDFKNPESVYIKIHSRMADNLNVLSEKAGEDASLSIIACSLGTIITSNYIYDTQKSKNEIYINYNSPLSRCKTLTNVFFMGSPIALWSLRYENYGMPIEFPYGKYSNIGQWINYYDKHDVIGYPLKNINKDYCTRVTEDRQVNVGGIFTSWNPASHLGYWNNCYIINQIAHKLASDWKKINSPQKD